MDIAFHVVDQALGARVGEVKIQDDTGIPPARIQKITKLKAGEGEHAITCRAPGADAQLLPEESTS